MTQEQYDRHLCASRRHGLEVMRYIASIMYGVRYSAVTREQLWNAKYEAWPFAYNKPKVEG